MKRFLIILLIVLVQFIFIYPSAILAATNVGLGTADSFAVLGGSGLTNTGTTVITGDVGSYPTTTQTGFGSVTVNGTNHAGDTITQSAKTDLVTGYNDAAGQSPTGTISADLGGQTLTPGVYRDNGAPNSLSLTGTLTLDAQGNSNAVFIFQSASTLITASGSSVSLVNGAQACNVFWQVGSSATLGTTTNFQGNILALTSITLNTGATVTGRVLARNGAVTMDTNTITKSTCTAATNSSTTSFSPSGPSFVYCPPLNSNVVAPVVISSRRVDSDSIFVSWGPYSGVDTFNVQYGTADGSWLYNTDVKGFSTTINSLPKNQSIWVRVAARNNCTINQYGASSVVGSSANPSTPLLPNTGYGPQSKNIFLNFLLSLIHKIYNAPIIQNKKAEIFQESQKIPLTLIIPTINVNANIRSIGLNEKGEMGIPYSAFDVGWFNPNLNFSDGTSVIDGHVDNQLGQKGVFSNLHKLKMGDKLYVEDNKGKLITFVVRETKIYDPGLAPEVFTSINGVHLNLVTCNGIWDESKKSYSKRLVVFTDAENTI